MTDTTVIAAPTLALVDKPPVPPATRHPPGVVTVAVGLAEMDGEYFLVFAANNQELTDAAAEYVKQSKGALLEIPAKSVRSSDIAELSQMDVNHHHAERSLLRATNGGLVGVATQKGRRVCEDCVPDLIEADVEILSSARFSTELVKPRVVIKKPRVK